MRKIGNLALCVAVAVVGASHVQVVKGQTGEWRAYSGDNAGSKYSPLDQINADTVHDLQVVWRQSTIPDAVRQGSTNRASTSSQNTPLMVGGLFYVSTGLGTVAALDATNGEVVWFDAAPDGAQRRGGSSRGVAYWTDGDDARIIALVGSSLVALNAKTGARYPDFGAGGEVNLVEGYNDTPRAELRLAIGTDRGQRRRHRRLIDSRRLYVPDAGAQGGASRRRPGLRRADG